MVIVTSADTATTVSNTDLESGGISVITRKSKRYPIGTITTRDMSKDDNWEKNNIGLGIGYLKVKDDDKPKRKPKKVVEKKSMEDEQDEEDEGDTTSPGYRVVSKAILITWPQQNLPDDFYSHLKTAVTSDNFHSSAWAITEEETKDGRPHYHAFMISTKRYDRNLSSFEVAGFIPGDCQKNQSKGPGAIISMARGLYYVIAPKTGTLRIDQNEKSKELINLHYKSTWARSLCAARKIPLNVYKTESVKYLNWSETMERDFNRLKSEVQTEDLKAHIDHTDAMIKENYTPYRTFEELDNFKRQFEHLRSRYKFAVIAGASLTGKSEMAVSMFQNPFEHKGVINWKGYDHEVHDGIVIHDVSNIFTYILKHREVFQSNNAMHTVNSSDANAFAFQIYLHRKPIVVVCNFDHMSKFGNEWLTDNSYVVMIPRGEVCYFTAEMVLHDEEENKKRRFLVPPTIADIYKVFDNYSEHILTRTAEEIYMILMKDTTLKNMPKVYFERTVSEGSDI